MASISRRHPPPVQFPVRRSRTLAVLLCGVAGLGLAVLSVWVLLGAGPEPGWRAWGTGATACVAAAGALHFWSSQLVGALRWDGQAWFFELPGATATQLTLTAAPQVLLDVQSHLWLHAVLAEHGRVWLWLERSACPEHWRDLRRAVYSRARPGVDNDDAMAPAPHRGRES